MAATKIGPILHSQIGTIQLIHGKPHETLKREKKQLRTEKQGDAGHPSRT